MSHRPEILSPCYVIEEDLLRSNLRTLQDVQAKAEVNILLAFKGFAMWSTFSIVREYLQGASASSVNEARLCFDEMGVLAHTYAPAYSSDQFDELLKLSSHITFNSLDQYAQFKDRLSEFSGHVISCGLRVNPEFSDVSTDLYNPASPVSRLGVTSQHLETGLPEGIEGLHFHVLCESTSHSLEKVLEAFEQRFGHLLPQIKWVNMGGGHLITDAHYDQKHLIQLLSEFKRKHDVEIFLEPGSAIAWQTGCLVSTVLDIVDNNGVKTAILDVSFTCHMPDCLEMPYRPAVRDASREHTEGWPSYRLGGLSCLAGDYLEAYYFPAELKVGDQVIFEDMIHYTMVKTTTFNGVAHPSMGMIKSDGRFEVIRRFGYQDYKDRLS